MHHPMCQCAAPPSCEGNALTHMLFKHPSLQSSPFFTHLSSLICLLKYSSTYQGCRKQAASGLNKPAHRQQLVLSICYIHARQHLLRMISISLLLLQHSETEIVGWARRFCTEVQPFVPALPSLLLYKTCCIKPTNLLFCNELHANEVGRKDAEMPEGMAIITLQLIQ